jgi:hypothetical protein
MAEHTECTDGDITTESLRVVLMGREDSQSSEPTVDHIQLLSLRTRVTIENLDTNRQGTFSAAEMMFIAREQTRFRSEWIRNSGQS